MQRMAMPNHLLRKLIVFTAVWLMFVMLFVGITLSITWRLEDRGMAINEAGSLRKQTYLMVALVQAGDTRQLPAAIEKFENQMQDLAQLKNGSLGSEIQNQYLQQLNTVQTGFTQFKARILTMQKNEPVPDRLLQETQLFVNDINALVKSIEHENTRSIQNMRKAQFLLIFTVLISSLMALLLLNQYLIQPALALQKGVSQLSQKAFSEPVLVPEQTEFYPVANKFNQLASRLQADFDELDQGLKQKNVALKQLQQQIQVFTQLMLELAHAPLHQDVLQTLLEKMLSALKLTSGSIRIMAADGSHIVWANHVKVSNDQKQDDSYLSQYQEYRSIQKAAGNDGQTMLNYRLIEGHSSDDIRIPIQGDQLYGWLTLYPHIATAITAHEEMLIRSLCAQLAVKLDAQTLQ